MTSLPDGIAIHRRDLEMHWCDSMWHLLARDERNRADRYVREGDRRRFVAGRHLIRTTLAPILGCAPMDVPISIDEYGRPSSAGAPSFSLSHSGNHIVLAIAHARCWTVGIDIEEIRYDIDPFALARQICAPVELEALHSCEHDRIALFFRLWTLKEAVLKAIGKGLSIDPRTVCIDLRNEVPVISNVPVDTNIVGFSNIREPVNYVGSVIWCLDDKYKKQTSNEGRDQ